MANRDPERTNRGGHQQNCRQALANHINETMHIRVSQNEVHLRVTPRGTDKYRWEVEKGNIALHRIFNPKRTISKLSKPECLLLSQEVGNSFRAVGTLGISLGEAASLEAKNLELLRQSQQQGLLLQQYEERYERLSSQVSEISRLVNELREDVFLSPQSPLPLPLPYPSIEDTLYRTEW